MNKRNFSTRRVYDKRSSKTSFRPGRGGSASFKKQFNMLLVWLLVVVNVGLIVFLVRRIFIGNSALPSTTEVMSEDAVTVEVLNGCGTTGVANVFADLLRQKKYDVVNIENAESFDYEKSVILDRGKRDQRQVDQVRSLLGISRDRVLKMESATSQCDLTFIVGSDYKDLKSYRNLR